MTLQERQDEFIELFGSLGTWQERFQYLIELGAELPEMPEHLRMPATQIMSCASRTFFLPSVAEGNIFIQGWSNASIPSGLIAVMRELFEGCPVGDLQKTEIDFHLKTDLINNLTEQRKAGLLEMIDRVVRL
jgi:cysteine desulfuration protein SufE